MAKAFLLNSPDGFYTMARITKEENGIIIFHGSIFQCDRLYPKTVRVSSSSSWYNYVCDQVEAVMKPYHSGFYFITILHVLSTTSSKLTFYIEPNNEEDSIKDKEDDDHVIHQNTTVLLKLHTRCNPEWKHTQWIRERPLYDIKQYSEMIICSTQDIGSQTIQLNEGCITNVFVLLHDGRIQTCITNVLIGWIQHLLLDIITINNVKDDNEKMILITSPLVWKDRWNWKYVFLTNIKRKIQPIHTLVYHQENDNDISYWHQATPHVMSKCLIQLQNLLLTRIQQEE